MSQIRLFVKNIVIGFTPIGILEVGMMDLEELKIFNNLIFSIFQPITPLFKHPIIPTFH
jgi:hypothetical protein